MPELADKIYIEDDHSEGSARARLKINEEVCAVFDPKFGWKNFLDKEHCFYELTKKTVDELESPSFDEVIRAACENYRTLSNAVSQSYLLVEITNVHLSKLLKPFDESIKGRKGVAKEYKDVYLCAKFKPRVHSEIKATLAELKKATPSDFLLHAESFGHLKENTASGKNNHVIMLGVETESKSYELNDYKSKSCEITRRLCGFGAYFVAYKVAENSIGDPLLRELLKRYIIEADPVEPTLSFIDKTRKAFRPKRRISFLKK